VAGPSGFFDNEGPIAIAHRGGAAAYGKDKYRKENTLEVFEATVKLGYTYLEMDVIVTADNEVIVLHVAKNKFEARQDKKAAPDYLTLQEMTHEEVKDFLKREIPTLRQVITSLPHSKFFIDCKTDRTVGPLATTIKKQKAQQKVCLGSFYPHRIIKLHQLLDDRASYRLIMSRSPVHLASQWQNFGKLKFILAVDLCPTCL